MGEGMDSPTFLVRIVVYGLETRSGGVSLPRDKTLRGQDARAACATARALAGN
ncbi:MAG: hypothetical protein ABSB82_06070 [Terriglobia bacterium]